ncbi:MAG: hypothetical protein ACRD5B_13490 [Nitrososphaeraceae archaeon]
MIHATKAKIFLILLVVAISGVPIPLANNINNVYDAGPERDMPKGMKTYRVQMNAGTTVMQMEKITHLIIIEMENVRTKEIMIIC